jgi:hypothetical protein
VPWDEGAGRHYFEAAVDAAAEIDEEAHHLLRSLSALAKRAADGDGGVREHRVARAFAAVVEACHWRLGDSDHFPWAGCIEALASLSPGMAAVAMARWDQRGIVALADHMNDFVRTCLVRGSISPEAAVSFSVLSPLGSGPAMTTALEGTSKLRAKPGGHAVADAALRILCDHARRLAPVGARRDMAEQVVLGAEQQRPNANLPEVRDLVTLRSFLSLIDKKAAAATDSPAWKPGDRPSTTAAALETAANSPAAAGEDPSTGAADLESAIRRLPGRNRYSTSAPEDEAVAELLTKVREATQPAHYPQGLQALIDLDPGLLAFDVLLAGLKDRLTHWGYHPLVQQWRRQLPTLLARHRFDDFFAWGHFSRGRLVAIERDLGVSAGAMVDALVGQLPEHVRDLNAGCVYGIAETLASALPPDMAMDVLEWQVNGLRARLDREGLVTAAVEASALPGPGPGLEAAVLWFLFGHPDTRLRWLAAHAARRMVRLGRSDVLFRLAERLDDGHASPFATPGTTFYWLAARQWFFLLIDRLSAEASQSVLPLAPVIAREVLAPDPPHALTMRFAKRAALRLAGRADSPYPAAMVEQIRGALAPPIKLEPEPQDRGPVRGSYRSGRAERFHFDAMDTLPYWYEPLGQLFGVEPNAFCAAAERWICNRWGFLGDVWRDDPVRKRYTGDHDYGLRSHRHGSRPTVEDLKTYLELNAMFCVAAELTRERPVLASRWDDEGDRWEHWLSRWDLAWQGEWLADRRQAPPLEPRLWDGSGFGSDEVWENHPGEEDFDRAIGILDPVRPGYLLAYADETRYRYEATEHVHVDTALVSAATADALLHALDGCPDPFDYRIPEEGDELEFNEQVGGAAFALKGWVRHVEADTDGIDSHDPLRYELRKQLAVPGSELVQRMGLVPDESQFRTCRRDGVVQQPVTVFEHWNDLPAGLQRHSFETEGRRLWVRLADALQVLRAAAWAIIVRCMIVRRAGSSRSTSRRDENDHGHRARLYLIHSDGTIYTSGGNHRFGPAAGGGTGAAERVQHPGQVDGTLPGGADGAGRAGDGAGEEAGPGGTVP